MTTRLTHGPFKSAGSRAHLIAAVGVLLLTLINLSQPALAVDVTWVFDGDGTWSDGTKWNGNPPNNAAHTAIIDDGDTAVTVTLDDSRSVAGLVLGTDDTLLMQAGSSVVQLTSDGSFTNDGSILMTSSNAGAYTYLYLGSNTLTNAATGLLHFQADQGDRYFNGNLVNDGIVQIDANTIFDLGGGSYNNNAQFNMANGGKLTIAFGGTLDQDGGTFDFDGTLNIGGSTFNMNDGTLDFDAAALIDNGNFNYVGGQINGDIRLRNVTFTIDPAATNAATFRLNDNNTLASDVGVGHTIQMEASGSVVQLTSNSSFTNDGSILMTSSNAGAYTYLFMSSNTLTNGATGLLHFQADQGDRYFNGNLINNGTVLVDQNTIFDLGAGLHNNNAQFNVDAGVTFTVSFGGAFHQDAGTFDLDGELEIGGSTFHVNGGTFDFDSAALIDNGVFNYTGGTITGVPKLRNVTLSIQPTATSPATFLMNDNNTLASDVGVGHTIQMEASGSVVQLTSNSSFTNDGSILMTSSNAGAYTYLFMSSNTLTNGATGLLHFQADQGDRYFNGNLINDGTVQVDQNTFFDFGGGSYTNNLEFNVDTGITFTISNGGTFDQDAGTFDLDGELEIGGSTFNVNGGTFDFDAAALIDNGNFNYAGGNILGTPKLRNVNLSIAPTATNPATFLMNDNNTLASDVGAGHTIRMEAVSNIVQLTASGSFTNDGLIEMTSSNAGTYTYLQMGGGTLTNGATGQLHFLADQGDRYFNGDLINDGTVLAEQTTTYFDKTNGSYDNNGLFLVGYAGTLRIINGGTLTNFAGNTLTGGIFDIRGTFSFTDADIHTNQAEIILRGVSSQIVNQSSVDALANLTTNGNAGVLRLLESRDFTASAAFTNIGFFELGGGTFDAPSLDNAAGANIFGHGTIVPRPTNSGRITANLGTLTFANGIQGGSGFVHVVSSGSLDVSGGSSDSSADHLEHDGVSLNLGDNNFLVGVDYDNANFGVGNAFNHRANVNGAGQINADPAVAQELTGNVTDGNTPTATLAFGNVHVGSSTSKIYRIKNAGGSTVSLRGAVQTSVNGGNITDGRLSGSGATAGNFGMLAPGVDTLRQVDFNATSAGALTGQQVHITNNFDNVADQNLIITGAAYRLASPSAHSPEPVNFGIRHVGDPAPSQALSITNNVPNDGFSERLNASIGSPTGGVTTNSGSFASLTPGATNNSSLVVGISTATAGVKTGTATISLTSNGTGTSGLGLTTLTSQTVNVIGTVNNYAVADMLKIGGSGTFTMTAPNTFSLDFGTIVEGHADPLAELGVTNDAIAAPADDLAGSFTLAAPAFDLSGFGAFSGLAAGNTHGGLLVGLDTATAGTFSGQITLSPQSVNPNPFSLNLPSITINLTGTVRLAGDFNVDESVDAADYVMMRKLFPTPAAYNIWRTNFGRSVGGGGGGGASLADGNLAVPEPSAIAFLLLGAITFAVHRPR